MSDKIFKLTVIGFIVLQLSINRTQYLINGEQIKNNALQQENLASLHTGLSATYQQQVRDFGDSDRRLNKLEK